MSHKPFEFRPSDLIEFEVVAPAPVVVAVTAPATAVDDKIEQDPLSINFGVAKDSKPTAAQRMLAGPTIDWLVAFPPAARPKALCERYPHVANRLAAAWDDRPRAALQLQQLVNDPRWGTAGYPDLVRAELQRVLQHLTGA